MLKVMTLFIFMYSYMSSYFYIFFTGLISYSLLFMLGDNWLFTNFFMYLDFFSYSLLLLTFWLSCLSMLSMFYFLNFKSKMNLNLMMYLLMMSLMMTFLSKNSLLFYFSFEISLIPMFFIILMWGGQIERVVSGLYLLFYTLFGSIPFFYLLVLMNLKSFFLMKYSSLDMYSNMYSFFMFLPFLVKFPMYSLHLWLLKAHVEAPVIGSMLLAGILLKLGGYGLVRTSLMWELNSMMKEFIIMFSMWGGLVMSIICLSLIDMKLLVAMSSIVHMSFCIACSVILMKWSIKAMLIMMVGHGLCSSGMFYICNLFYEMSFSRSLIMMKGLLSLTPSLLIWWFMLCSSNMSSPPSLNLVSELMMSISLMNWSMYFIIILVFLLFFSASYSLYLYFSILHSNMTIFLSMFYNCMNYMLVLMCHWLPLNLLVVSLFIF